MKLTNYTIYTSAQKLQSAFVEKTQYLPAKINFYLQKNIQTISTLAQEIEKSRQEMVSHYAIPDSETGEMMIPKDKLMEASQELEDLFQLEQEVNIYMINIDSFGDIQLSMEQMDAILFMVEG